MKTNNANLDKARLGIKNGLEMKLINILLNADGSTTRLLETLVGDQITVQVHRQDFLLKESLPLEPIRYFKGNGRYLYRVISLCYQGKPISDNIVVAPETGLDGVLQSDLIKGQIPLGKLIGGTEHRREFIATKIMHSSEVQDLFQSFELADGFFPIKRYIIIKDSESWFYICEVFHYKTIAQFFHEHTWNSIAEPVAAKN